MLENICQVNAIVAGEDGKGREDFKFSTLNLAEKLLKPNNESAYSRAVLHLASNVSETFEAYRELIRNYMTNIELIDP